MGATPEQIDQRFWAKIDKDGPGGCWIWLGVRASQGQGYGRRTINGTKVYVHRWAYERFVGPIPDGLTIDHLCRNSLCCNPDHLEVVTGRENTLRSENPTALHARQTHCLRGHPFDDNNTYRYKNRRICRTCAREADKRRTPRYRATLTRC